MNYIIIGCNQLYKNRSVCSCQDCEVSCVFVLFIFLKLEFCKIFYIDCYYFVFVIVCLVFNLFFFIYVICYNILVRNFLDVMDSQYFRFEDEDGDYSGVFCVNGDGKKKFRFGVQRINVFKVFYVDISCLEKIGLWMEIFLESFFYVWGIFCVRYFILVMVVGLVVVGVLFAGIFVFQVIIDFVKLWSVKDSQVRIERDYFDFYFGYGIVY